MRLYEFLALVLEAHGQVLKMLAEYHGSSGAAHLLEMGSSAQPPPTAPVIRESRDGSVPWDLAFDRIESAVRALCLSEELETWVCGKNTVDIDLLMRHTNYSGAYSAEHPVITMFWKMLRECREEEK